MNFRFFLCLNYDRCYNFQLLSIVSCIQNTEIAHKQDVYNVQKLILTYICNVQHATAEDHQLDQFEFFYNLHKVMTYDFVIISVFNFKLSIVFSV